MRLIDQLDVVDAFMTLREVRLAFVWSRLVVVDETTIKGRTKIVQLHFEDFLETLVRLAHMMALPTEDDLTHAGLTHAGEWLDALRDQPDAENEFKRLNTCALGETLSQPIAWKVRQFILRLIFIARGRHGDPEDGLSTKEAMRFSKGVTSVPASRDGPRATASRDGTRADVALPPV